MDYVDNISNYSKSKTLQIKDTLFSKVCTQPHGDKLDLYLDYNIFSLVYKGQKRINIDSSSFYVSEGEGFFLSKNQYVNSVVTSQENYESVVIMFDEVITSSLIEQLKMELPKLDEKISINQNFFKIEQSPYLVSYSDSIKAIIDDNILLVDEILRLKLQEIILYLFSLNRKEFIHYILSCFTNKKNIIQIMEENFYKPLSLNDFAKLNSSSLSKFKREFKIIFDDTPMNWLKNKRLEHATYLIKFHHCNATQACYYSGFKDYSYFSKVFKKKYTFSPNQIRL